MGTLDLSRDSEGRKCLLVVLEGGGHVCMLALIRLGACVCSVLREHVS